jgi:hypothetical protein
MIEGLAAMQDIESACDVAVLSKDVEPGAVECSLSYEADLSTQLRLANASKQVATCSGYVQHTRQETIGHITR